MSGAKLQAEGIVSGALRCIPAGTFTMAIPHNTDITKQVTVAAFCMDTTRVTTAAYATCAKSGKCTAPVTGDDYNFGVVGRERHPINGVD